jgi:hypothetical protein
LDLQRFFGGFMKNINMIKYTFASALISFFWAFIGGIVISLNNKTPSSISTGAAVFFVGSIISFFVFTRIVKKGKIIWFLKKKS